ncbi:hypothetical protein GCM10020258_32700 [Sphingomonas yabuuchiae]
MDGIHTNGDLSVELTMEQKVVTCFGVKLLMERMMPESIDEYDLTPIALDATSTAKYLVGRKNRQLFVASAAAVVIGVIHANWSGSHTVFPRYGAAVTLLAIIQSWRQLQYQKMLPRITQFQVDLFTGIEREKLGDAASEEAVKARVQAG